MSNRPVTSMRAKKRGTTRFLTGSTPRTCSASSSSRILRAPRSAVIAAPATPASTIAVTKGANSRMLASTKKPPTRELGDAGGREEAAGAVVGAEEREEVARLQARRGVAEGDRRDHQREPAQPQREQELLHELAAVWIGRAQGRHDGLPRQDHHVAHFLQQPLGRKEYAIGDVANQVSPLSRGTPPGDP